MIIISITIIIIIIRAATGARRARLRAARGAELDVQGGEAELLAARGDILRGQHRRVRRGLVTIGLHLHAAGHADDGLAAGDVLGATKDCTPEINTSENNRGFLLELSYGLSLVFPIKVSCFVISGV